MIPEYKRYHGAVFAEIIDLFPGTVSIEEWPEKGRLSSYVLNGEVGLHIKHSGARMSPWQFTVTDANFDDIARLRERCEQVFIVLVCWLDGMVCVSDAEFETLVDLKSNRPWLRTDRRKRELYVVSGPLAELPNRKPNGVIPILQALGGFTEQPCIVESPRSPSFWPMRYLQKLWVGIFG